MDVYIWRKKKKKKKKTMEWSMDTDLEWSFTSATTTSTSCCSSGRTSSLALSFNERSNSNSNSNSSLCRPHPHGSSDPHWSAIRAASNLSSSGCLELRHLKLVGQLGSGNLGRVFLCRLRDCPSESEAGVFALKVVDKESLSPKKLSQAKTEGDVLASLDHPFLPTLYARIEASRYTCLLIDYCPGGDLHSLLRRPLSLSAVRFVAAEVLLALQYLHSLGIVYRDLKPENILLRADGHIMLSDFDLCFTVPQVHPHLVSLPSDRGTSCFPRPRPRPRPRMEIVAEPTGAWSRSCVGTHEYLAPELVGGKGHGSAVDWWALGVLIHELMYGTTPFKGDTKDATLRNIMAPINIKRGGRDCAGDDLIRRLLVNDPAQRLGSTMGAAHIKRHPFFKSINWALIRNRTPPKDLLPSPRCS